MQSCEGHLYTRYQFTIRNVEQLPYLFPVILNERSFFFPSFSPLTVGVRLFLPLFLDVYRWGSWHGDECNSDGSEADGAASWGPEGAGSEGFSTLPAGVDGFATDESVARCVPRHDRGSEGASVFSCLQFLSPCFLSKHASTVTFSLLLIHVERCSTRVMGHAAVLSEAVL